jgi:dihydrofolate reductase
MNRQSGCCAIRYRISRFPKEIRQVPEGSKIIPLMIIGIAAVDRQGAIGKGGKLPWHYSADMKFFRETTTGHAVVMGRKTWLTLDKPLKNRLNIVLSRDQSIEPQESLLVLSDVDAVLSFNESLTTDLFVIGGAQIYEAFLPRIERWIITEVPLKVDGADAFMPRGYLDGFRKGYFKQIGEGLTVKFYDRT